MKIWISMLLALMILSGCKLFGEDRVKTFTAQQVTEENVFSYGPIWVRINPDLQYSNVSGDIKVEIMGQMDKPTLWLVSQSMQEKEVTEYCFGKCGKIIVGAVDMGELGAWMPCRTAECPYLDKESVIDGFSIDDDKIIAMRKLKGDSDVQKDS